MVCACALTRKTAIDKASSDIRISARVGRDGKELVDGFLRHGLDQVTLEAGDRASSRMACSTSFVSAIRRNLRSRAIRFICSASCRLLGIRQVEVEEHHAGLKGTEDRLGPCRRAHRADLGVAACLEHETQ